MNEQLIEEYKKAYLPEDINFRTVKILCENGQWVTSKRKISNKIQWGKFLDSLPSTPFKVYISLNNWLQPGALKGRVLTKAGYLVDSQVLIKQRLLFDFDPGLFPQERVRMDALKLILWMERYHKNYKLDYIQASSKGLHLIYVDPYKIKEADVFKRQDAFKRRRDNLLKFVPKLDTLDLTGVSSDIRRVFKLETYYSLDTGLRVSRISPSTLRLHSMKWIVDRLDHAPVNPEKGNDKSLEKRRYRENNGESLASGAPSSPIFIKYVKNCVWGCKNLFVPFLFFRKEEYSEKFMRKIQRIYKLGGLYEMSSGKLKIVVGLRPQNFRRILKIMQASKSLYVSTFKKYKQVYLYVSDMVDKNLQVVREKIKFDKVLEGEFTYVSHPHLRMLYAIAGIDLQAKTLIGCNDYKIGVGVWTNEQIEGV